MDFGSNGAFSTANCRLLLKALQWASAPERGNVRVLALMVSFSVTLNYDS